MCRGKEAKERMTAIVAANMSDSEKLPLMVIGKSLKPRCLNNVKNLPVEYKANKKAWMTSTIFETWLRKLDRKFFLQGRTIAMIVDNCPAHHNIDSLRSIKPVFLPLNTYSHVIREWLILWSATTELELSKSILTTLKTRCPWTLVSRLFLRSSTYPFLKHFMTWGRLGTKS